MKQLFLLIGLCVIASAQIEEMDIFPLSYKSSDTTGIRILDSKVLTFEPVDKIRFAEISALAYHKVKGLYALSDRGNLFRFELQIENEKIKKLTLIEATALKTKKSKSLKKKKS